MLQFWLQVICWVLGEYGIADGKFSASYITGKLCDVAEAYSNDETVKVSVISEKVYSVTATIHSCWLVPFKSLVCTSFLKLMLYQLQSYVYDSNYGVLLNLTIFHS